MSDIKVIHYRDKCIGCHACVCVAKNNWKINDSDGKSDLIGAVKKGNAHVVKILDEEVYENISAAKSCPVNIIQVHKDGRDIAKDY